VPSDLVIEKINTVRRCLARIVEVTQGDPSTLQEINIQDIYVLNLQRAVQACIDLSQTVIREQQWSLPDTYREGFVLLKEKKVLSDQISLQMQKMCGFRNIAIHEYQTLDVEILKSILTKDLADIEKFHLEVLAFLDHLK
jgi:uncharacterized protein YutE (UPF0331/DUF86 family)